MTIQFLCFSLGIFLFIYAFWKEFEYNGWYGIKKRLIQSFYMLILCAGVIFVFVFIDHLEKQKQAKALIQTIEISPINLKDKLPTVSNQSIYTAIKHYKIQVPKKIYSIEVDYSYEQRGLIERTNKFFLDSKVSIGPNAFSSWAMLASTLVHELEIHANQDMAWNSDDLMKENEREAYTYEINNQKRLGLTDSEVLSIQDSMDFYFPENKNSMAHQ